MIRSAEKEGPKTSSAAKSAIDGTPEEMKWHRFVLILYRGCTKVEIPTAYFNKSERTTMRHQCACEFACMCVRCVYSTCIWCGVVNVVCVCGV